MISSRVKFELAAPTLMKSNRITAEEQDKDKIGKLCLKERLVDKNGWQHYVYQADECTLHGVYVRGATGIELYCIGT